MRSSGIVALMLLLGGVLQTGNAGFALAPCLAAVHIGCAAATAGYVLCCIAGDNSCIAAAAATACFHDSTKIVKVLGSDSCLNKQPRDLQENCTQQIFVKDIRRGDLVLTLDSNGEQITTRVMTNKRHEGAFNHVAISMSAHNLAKNLTVTANHVMLVQRGSAQRSLVQAKDIVLGDVVRMHGLGLAVVDNLQPLVLDHKNELLTMEGTVLANGAHVTTMCGEYSEKQGDIGAVLSSWRSEHAIVEEMMGLMEV